MKKVGCFSILVAAAVLTFVVIAEAQPAKIPRIGLIIGQSRLTSQSEADGFRRGLRELGYVEDKNIVIDYRYAEGREDLLRDFASDLVRLKVEIIVTASTVAAIEAKRLTGTIPIVVAGTGDPVATGLVASLARPGGNVTGLSAVSPELSTKQLELIREVVPKVSRVGVLFDPRNPANLPAWKQIEITATAFRIELIRLEIRDRDDYESAFTTAAQKRAHALLVRREPINQTYRTRIVSLALVPRILRPHSKLQLRGELAQSISGWLDRMPLLNDHRSESSQ